MQSPLTFQPNAVVIVFGVGLMGQDFAKSILKWTKVKKLILVDAKAQIAVGTDEMSLLRFAECLENPDSAEIVPIVADITDETMMNSLFTEHQGINYLVITSGISPKPLTPPEELDQAFAMMVMKVNTWGPVNVVNAAVRRGALAEHSKGVVLLSTSATDGSEGRATMWYEASKWALLGWLTCQAKYYLKKCGLVLNGISPSPLQGPMASANPTSAGRLEAVAADTPMGLTTAPNISAQIAMFLSNECNSAGQNVVVCGSYTLTDAVYGPLPTT